jgi:uncharacterized protein YndB with AHSA1/START domain
MKLDLRISEVFERPVEAVWLAITDRRILARWLMDNDFEPRVGHKFALRDPPTSTWRGWVECEVLELEPPRRMVWSWNSGMAGETATRVVFELRQEGTATRLTLRHEGKAVAGKEESVTSGWKRKVGVLARVLGPHYARRVSFSAAREKVFEAIATVEGLRGWWTPLVGGSTAPGREIRFNFEGLDEHIIMRVDEATRPACVRWTCLKHTGLDDWAGTALTFDLASRGSDGSELGFQHVGLSPHLECYATCEQGWEHFLASLVSYIDRGVGAPFGTGGRHQRSAAK